MAKKTEETTVKKTTTVKIEFRGSSATIYREGLPMISDKTENSVKWLADKGYKPEQIEIVGDKPQCFDAIFSPPPAPVEPISDPADVTAVQETIVPTPAQ